MINGTLTSRPYIGGGSYGPPNVTWATSSIVEEEVLTSKNGGKTPGWRRLKNSGCILPVNPYTVSRTTISKTVLNGSIFVSRYPGGNPTGMDITTNFYYPGYETFSFPVPTPTDADINGVMNSAIADATASKMMMLVNIGELNKTWSMLKSAVQRIVTLRLRVTLLAQRKSVPVDSLWLEYRYGWLPLYHEVLGAIDIANGALKKGDRQHGTGVRVLSASESKTSVYPSGKVNIVVDETLSATVRLRGFALSEVVMSFLARYGINPITTSWDLVPFSWMLDWFLDVGSWLASVTQGASGFDVKSSGYSVRTSITRQLSLNVYPGSPAGGFIATAGSWTGQSYREIQEGFLRLPASGGGVPPFRMQLSNFHIADLMAVISQSLGGRPLSFIR